MTVSCCKWHKHAVVSDRIVRSTLFEAVSVVGTADIYYLFNGLLLTLQVLHIIWFYFILLIAKDAVFEGQVSHGPHTRLVLGSLHCATWQWCGVC